MQTARVLVLCLVCFVGASREASAKPWFSLAFSVSTIDGQGTMPGNLRLGISQTTLAPVFVAGETFGKTDLEVYGGFASVTLNLAPLDLRLSPTTVVNAGLYAAGLSPITGIRVSYWGKRLAYIVSADAIWPVNLAPHITSAAIGDQDYTSLAQQDLTVHCQDLTVQANVRVVARIVPQFGLRYGASARYLSARCNVDPTPTGADLLSVLHLNVGALTNERTLQMIVPTLAFGVDIRPTKNVVVIGEYETGVDPSSPTWGLRFIFELRH